MKTRIVVSTTPIKDSGTKRNTKRGRRKQAPFVLGVAAYVAVGCFVLSTTSTIGTTRNNVAAFDVSSLLISSNKKQKLGLATTTTTTAKTNVNAKSLFLESLETIQSLNVATRERTQLVQRLTDENPTPRPGSQVSFAPLAKGTWSVIYAPHIYTMGTLAWLGAKSTTTRSSQAVGDDNSITAKNNKKNAAITPVAAFDPIIYQLETPAASDGPQTMVSHARFEIPWWPSTTNNKNNNGVSGWLSVSGTYGSQDEDRVCRVDFDKAWIKWNNNNNDDDDDNDKPYPSLEAVPDSLEKNIIQTIGKLLFIDSVSVFPVAYLDEELIVFDFELLKTRICARKL